MFLIFLLVSIQALDDIRSNWAYLCGVDAAVSAQLETFPFAFLLAAPAGILEDDLASFVTRVETWLFKEQHPDALPADDPFYEWYWQCRLDYRVRYTKFQKQLYGLTIRNQLDIAGLDIFDAATFPPELAPSLQHLHTYLHDVLGLLDASARARAADLRDRLVPRIYATIRDLLYVSSRQVCQNLYYRFVLDQLGDLIKCNYPYATELPFSIYCYEHFVQWFADPLAGSSRQILEDLFRDLLNSITPMTDGFVSMVSSFLDREKQMYAYHLSVCADYQQGLDLDGMLAAYSRFPVTFTQWKELLLFQGLLDADASWLLARSGIQTWAVLVGQPPDLFAEIAARLAQEYLRRKPSLEDGDPHDNIVGLLRWKMLLYDKVVSSSSPSQLSAYEAPFFHSSALSFQPLWYYSPAYMVAMELAHSANYAWEWIDDIASLHYNKLAPLYTGAALYEDYRPQPDAADALEYNRTPTTKLLYRWDQQWGHFAYVRPIRWMAATLPNLFDVLRGSLMVFTWIVLITRLLNDLVWMKHCFLGFKGPLYLYPYLLHIWLLLKNEQGAFSIYNTRYSGLVYEPLPGKSLVQRELKRHMARPSHKTILDWDPFHDVYIMVRRSSSLALSFLLQTFVLSSVLVPAGLALTERSIYGILLEEALLVFLNYLVQFLLPSIHLTLTLVCFVVQVIIK